MGSWGAIDTSEARYSEIPRQIVETGDWMHPVYLGIEHYHKPPLTYQITALSYHIFGVGMFGARIMLHVALAFQLLCIWLITKEIFRDRHKAAVGTLIYSSFFIVWIGTRNLTTDLYLTSFLLATIYALIRYAKRGNPGFLYLAAMAGGLAFLTKITASLVILGPLALTVYWLYRKTWKWTWHFLPAAILYLAISLSWFLALQNEGKDVLRYLLYDHSVVRYTTDTFGRSNPWYFYLLAVVVLGFPWVIMLFQAVYRQWRARTLSLESGLLLAIWGVFPILFYTVSHSKLILYILPAFAAFAILAPHHIALMSPRTIKVWLKVQLTFYVLLIAGLLTYPLYSDFSMQIAPHLVLTGLLIASLMILMLAGDIRRRMRMALMSAVFALFAIMISTHVLSENELQLSTAKPVADWIKSEKMEDRNIFVYDRLVPSLSFHLQGPTAMIASSEKRELQFESDDDWKAYYFNLERTEDAQRLEVRLATPSVLVSRRRQNVPEHLVTRFRNETEIGKWKVYY